MTKIMKTAVFLCLAVLSLLMLAAPASCDDTPRIARWYQNRGGAVSLRFDDSLESQVNIAIPLLNRYGFKATFMVNPGTDRYRSHKDFWERQVPAMGHSLGDHTMHHMGARNLRDADYEIGEAARTIWRVYPRESRLLVFASGGGKQWGDRDWEEADPAYRRLVEKYHLIDLYDGRHPSKRVGAENRSGELCDLLDRALASQSYQAFHFHDVGEGSFMNSAKALFRGYDLTTSEETFSGFLQCLAGRRDRLWIAPVIDILKYEEEARGAGLKVLRSDRKSCTLALTVKTDPSLYDYKLTVVLPSRKGTTIKGVTQDGEEPRVYHGRNGESLADVRPVNSTIRVWFN